MTKILEKYALTTDLGIYGFLDSPNKYKAAMGVAIVKMKKEVEYEKVLWSQVFGNKYSLSLHHKMLTEPGYSHPRKGRTIDQSSYDPNKKLLIILFNKEYVINYIIVKLIVPLRIRRTNLLELINEAYDEFDKALNPNEYIE